MYSCMWVNNDNLVCHNLIAPITEPLARRTMQISELYTTARNGGEREKRRKWVRGTARQQYSYILQLRN